MAIGRCTAREELRPAFVLWGQRLELRGRLVVPGTRSSGSDSRTTDVEAAGPYGWILSCDKLPSPRGVGVRKCVLMRCLTDTEIA